MTVRDQEMTEDHPHVTDLIMMTEDHHQVIDAVTKTATDATEDRETITRRNFLTES
jgi:hypothetical protein